MQSQIQSLRHQLSEKDAQLQQAPAAAQAQTEFRVSPTLRETMPEISTSFHGNAPFVWLFIQNYAKYHGLMRYST